MTAALVAAIAGIGATEFSRDSGRSERLAAKAVRAAVRDAGLRPGDVDGLTGSPWTPVRRSWSRAAGVGELTFG